jgi:dihydrofolate reductase
MGKLIASIFVSIDNIMVAENEDMSWVLDNFDPEMGEDMGKEVMNSMQAILIGHTTYDIMVKHWPNMIEAEAPGADQMNHTPKFVFSKSLKKAEWGKYDKATVVKEIIPEEIERMKKQSGEKMVIMGSASLVQQFTNLHLIDEYVLWLHPVVLGSGKPLFQDIKVRNDLSLIKAKTYKTGVIALTLLPKK